MRAIAYVSNLMSRVGVEALDRADQAEQPVRDEVAFVDVGRQAAPEPPRDVLHERRVREDQPVAGGLVAGPLVLGPQGAGVVLLVGHVAEDRRKSGFREISAVFLPERLEASSPIQTARNTAAARDHPEAAALIGRVEPQRAGSRPRGRRRALRGASGAPRYNASSPRAVAQLAEHRSPKPGVPGSSPGGPVPVRRAGIAHDKRDSGFSLALYVRSKGAGVRSWRDAFPQAFHKMKAAPRAAPSLRRVDPSCATDEALSSLRPPSARVRHRVRVAGEEKGAAVGVPHGCAASVALHPPRAARAVAWRGSADNPSRRLGSASALPHASMPHRPCGRSRASTLRHCHPFLPWEERLGHTA